MTPLLVLLLGVSPQTAVGTDLIYASLTKVFGVAVHGSQGRVDWQVVQRLSLGSLPASILTLIWMHAIGASEIRHGTILFALGVVLILTSLTMLSKPQLNRIGKRLRIGDPVHFKKYQPVLTVLAGGVLGFLVTLTSIGAGALGAVMLVFLYPLRLTPARLVATDLAHAIPLALIAGAGHIWLGNVDFVLLGNLLLGSIPGVMLGAHYGSRMPDKILRTGIAIMLGMIGVKLL